jgi:hypothetical protein
MLPLVQICIVVATLGVVAIAAAALRVMYRVDKASRHVSRLSGEIREWIVQANELTRDARETVASVREAIAPLRRVAQRFETLGERTADLSATVLEEVESPLRTAIAVVRGVRSGTAYLMERLSNRFTHGRSATNGGSESE